MPAVIPATAVAPPRMGEVLPGASLTPVSWIPTRDLDLAEWTAAGRRLGAIGRCGQWGLGDWIRYGNAKFGERYSRAARITGYDVQTLMNMVYVASRFTISRRREILSWSHHETLAALDADAQDHWLDRAAAERLSISDLRLELRDWRRRSRENVDADGKFVEAPRKHESVLCPNCGARVLVPAREHEASAA
jgi:hypothetical protein